MRCIFMRLPLASVSNLFHYRATACNSSAYLLFYLLCAVSRVDRCAWIRAHLRDQFVERVHYDVMLAHMNRVLRSNIRYVHVLTSMF